MSPQLQKKVDFAINLLQTAAANYKDIELAYSGGKDSDVILELAKMAGIPFTAIYKNTTIDPPGTIKHCEENGVQIANPKVTFFQLIEQKGSPSRFARFCCQTLKEYKIKDTVILGVRRDESIARRKRYHEPEMCRVYSNGEKAHQILPILDWTLEDVKEFIIERNIKLAPAYYDENENIDFTRRLGCLGCPLASRKQRISEFKKYPKLLRQWIKRTEVWWNKKPRSIHKFCDSVFEMYAVMLFSDTIKKRILNKESLFKTDYKKALEDYFGFKY